MSGGGDGALVDLVRAAVPREDYEGIVKRLATLPSAIEYAKQIGASKGFDLALAVEPPPGLADAVFQDSLANARVILWNAITDGYLPHTALLHRVLVHLLISKKRIAVKERGRTKPTSVKNKIKVTLESNRKVHAFVDVYIARWGPKRPRLLERLDLMLKEIEEAGRNLSAIRQQFKRFIQKCIDAHRSHPATCPTDDVTQDQRSKL